MIFNRPPKVYAKRNKLRDSNRLPVQFMVLVMLSFICISNVTARQEPGKFYVQIAHSISSDNNDLNITSLGAISLENNMVGHVHLTHLASEKNGNAMALELGAGAAYNWIVSPYISVGIALGYNGDNNEKVVSCFPEIGVVVDFTEFFGITISGKRYYKLYDEYDDVIMFGLVFRK